MGHFDSFQCYHFQQYDDLGHSVHVVRTDDDWILSEIVVGCDYDDNALLFVSTNEYSDDLNASENENEISTKLCRTLHVLWIMGKALSF